jgi:hypothetical protein
MPLQVDEIKERCSCGATFSMTSSSDSVLKEAAAQWRETHKHDMPAAPEMPQFEHREVESSWVHADQPRYIGFAPNWPDDPAPHD